jgi:hypothetical protein
MKVKTAVKAGHGCVQSSNQVAAVQLLQTQTLQCG